ncbi:MAG: NADH-quinone oxidoreductase subunit E, partial [Lentisphaerae bacterium]|nr:NADH-quinone oxidoreductase subunit E [Lentisphaerota bacterium]
MGNPIQQRYEALAEQAESTLSALRRPSHIFIQIGSATCEHAAGSREVESEFRKHIEASGRKDIILRRTGCTGRCSREPIVGVFMPDGMPTKYEQVGRDAVHKIFTSHIQGGIPVTELVLDASEDEQVHKYDLLFCRGARCGRNLDFNVQDAFRDAISTGDLTPGAVRILDANCFGLCTRGEGGHTTHVLVRPSKVIYRVDSQDDVDEIVQEHLQGGRTVERLRVSSAPMTQRFFDRYGDVAFFSRQSRIALRNAGVVDPESIDEYTHYRGFLGLSKVLSNDNPEWVISELLTAKLRGRGGGGFPTGKKWAAARTSEETTRYIICNADEGDPGAFMDRSMLESDPFNVIEGMIIGGFAIGASRGFIYLRAEYPLAIKRIEHAIAECRQRGLLGKDVMGSGFSFDLEVRL